MTLGQPTKKWCMISRPRQRGGDVRRRCHCCATVAGKSARQRRIRQPVEQPVALALRSNDMRPDYLDKAKNATARGSAAAPTPLRDGVGQALRHAFVAPEQTDREWAILLARMP